jgi:hypothetical protein
MHRERRFADAAKSRSNKRLPNKKKSAEKNSAQRLGQTNTDECKHMVGYIISCRILGKFVQKRMPGDKKYQQFVHTPSFLATSVMGRWK